ncbi:hypothetical protein, partial [Pseudomonas poae]|uniref:hypothetical protein n=1 Tax=Pseudomonas poae TaxID=200451 RepID=UPI0034D41E91
MSELGPAYNRALARSPGTEIIIYKYTVQFFDLFFTLSYNNMSFLCKGYSIPKLLFQIGLVLLAVL